VAFTLSIVLFFVGLLIVILIHELGHYTVARAFGFKVEEYFVGFGPKLWSTRRGEIEYGVKALPLGGYVKIAGMNPYQPVAPEDLPRAYGSKPRWQRALVIAAGPGVHFLIAAILFTAWLTISGDPLKAAPVVTEVQPILNGHPSPAAEAGLRPGDVVVGLGDTTDPSGQDLSEYTTSHVGTPAVFTVLRAGRTLRLVMTPQAAKVDGVTIGRVGVIVNYDATPEPIGSAAVDGVRWVGTSAVESVSQVGRVFGPQGIERIVKLVFTNEQRQAEDPTSVVGIGRAVGQTGRDGGYASILFALGFVTVFIGLVNLAPLPPFDGGHLAVLLIEKIRGKTVDPRRVIPVAVAVMGFFVVFVTLTMIADLAKPVT
jgi:membrane-associated protease RseP (regulator of RpoE activity)